MGINGIPFDRTGKCTLDNDTLYADIEEKDYILPVNRYIERKVAEVKPYEVVKAEFKQAYENMVAAEAKFRELLIAGGYQL